MTAKVPLVPKESRFCLLVVEIVRNASFAGVELAVLVEVVLSVLFADSELVTFVDVEFSSFLRESVRPMIESVAYRKI